MNSPNPYDVTEEEWEEARQTLRAMQELVVSAGWQKIRTTLLLQQKARQIMGPMASFDDMIAKQGMLGEITGLGVALGLPQLLMEVSQETIDRYVLEKELNNAAED